MALGTLSIDVIANIAEMVSDLGKASDETKRFAQEAKEHAKEAAEAIEGIKESLKGLLELAGISLSFEFAKEIIEKSAEAAEQVQHLTQSLGMSAETIQTMSFAAGLIGGNLDTATMAMTRLERAGEQAIAGTAQQVEAFRSIGIESSKLAELLKQPDELIQTVAHDLAGFQDGAAKTAVVMQLFGRNAAQIIPLLNELGHNFDELKEKGEQFGIVLSAADQKSLFETAESINQLKEAATGLGNEFTLALAPAVRVVLDTLTALATSDFVRSVFSNLKTDIAQVVVMFGDVKSAIADVGASISRWYQDFVATMPGMHNAFADSFGGMRQDAAQFVADSMSELDTLKTWFKNGALYIQIAWEQLWVDIQNGFNSMLAGINSGLQTVVEWSKGAFNNLNDPFGTMRAGLDQLSASLKSAGTSFTPLTADVSGLREQIEMNNLGLETAKLANDHWAQSIRDAVTAHNAHGEALDSEGKKLLDYDAKVKASTEDVIKLSAELAKWSEANDKLLSTQDPLAKAQASFNEQMTKATEELVVMLGHGLKWADALTMLDQRTDLLTQAEQRELAAAYAKSDVLASLEQKYKGQALAVGQLTNAGLAEAEVDKAINDEIKKLTDQYGALSPFVADVTAKLIAKRDATIADVTAFKDHAQAIKLDEEAMKEWMSIAQNGFDSAFQAIDKDLIEGGSIMSDLANVAKTTVEQILLYFEKLLIINPLLNSIFGLSGTSMQLPSGLGGLSQLLGGGLNGAGSSLMSGNGLLGNLFGNSWVQSLFGSTAGAGSGLMGMLFGGSGSFDMFAGMSGVADIGDIGTAGLGLESGLGVTPGTSGLLSSGGNIWGGLGTAGSILGGAMAGYQLGGWGGAAALGALSYAIPVVGWIAGLASLVNSFTGGDLFGTSYKPTGTTFENLSFGQSGVGVQNLVQEHKHGAFFSGGSWRDVQAPVSQDQLDSAQKMYDSIKSTIDSAATALGVDAATLITGTLKEQFDSKGNITSSISTILGQTYKDTVQQFAERVTADNLLALLPAAQHAQEIAAQWQSSADTLLAGTQMLVQAQVDINRSMSLLGDDSSLSDITKVVQKLAVSGESLMQTYVRLQAEQEDLKSTLDELGMSTGKTGADFVTFADNLTKAAGGLSNLNSAWSTYYGEYYSQAERQANTMKQLQQTVDSAFAAIGEDPKESMAKFRQDFEAAMPTLTPAQVIQWLAAADALAKITAANQALANAAGSQTAQEASAAAAAKAAAEATAAALEKAKTQYDQFVNQFDPATLGLTSFESSLFKLDGTMASNIQQANALAKAAGMAGVANSDLANIITASVQQGVDALKQFEAQTQQLAQSLYGTNLQALQTQLTSLQAADKARLAGMDPYAASQIQPILAAQEAKLQQQIDAANAQAQAAQRLSDASTLLQDFAQIGTLTGKSLADLAKTDNVPLDKFAADLGLTQEELKAQFAHIEDQVQAAMKANQLLEDILAVLQGKQISAISATSTVIGGKSSPVTVTAPQQEQQLQALNERVDRLTQAIIRLTESNQAGSRNVVDAIATRTTRDAAGNFAGPRTMQPPRTLVPA